MGRNGHRSRRRLAVMRRRMRGRGRRRVAVVTRRARVARRRRCRVRRGKRRGRPAGCRRVRRRRVGGLAALVRVVARVRVGSGHVDTEGAENGLRGLLRGAGQAARGGRRDAAGQHGHCRRRRDHDRAAAVAANRVPAYERRGSRRLGDELTEGVEYDGLPRLGPGVRGSGRSRQQSRQPGEVAGEVLRVRGRVEQPVELGIETGMLLRRLRHVGSIVLNGVCITGVPPGRPSQRGRRAPARAASGRDGSARGRGWPSCRSAPPRRPPPAGRPLAA